MSETATESQTDTPPADRLVIRIKMISEELPPPAPPAPRASKGAIALIVGAVVLLAGWFGIGSLRSDPPPPPAVAEKSPIAAATDPVLAPAKMVEPEVPQQPDAPLAAINEVLPDVPQSALDTIRGTVRVVIRVTIDKQGSVIAASAEDRGPSRYFERLSKEASKKWTFTPANLADQRTMLIHFNFTRYGATAHLS